MTRELLLLLILLPSAVFAGKSYDIQLELRDEFTNNAIVGAQITINYETNGSMITDSTGMFVYTGCTDKNVLITITHDAYQDSQTRVFKKKMKYDELVRLTLFPKEKALDSIFKLLWSRIHNEMVSNYGHLLDTNDYDDKLVNCSEVTNLYTWEAGFPGGSSKMKKYISNYIVYPEDASKKRDQGKVDVGFIIDPDGSVVEVEILRGVSSALDKEALRIIRSMPRWIPAYCNGRTVKTRVRLPIMFKG